MNRIRIGARLAAAFVALLALTTALGIFSIAKLASVKAASGEITAKWMPGARLTAQMNTDASDFRIAEAQHILSTEDEERNTYEKDMGAISLHLEAAGRQYAALVTSPEEKALWDAVQRERRRYLDENLRIVRMSRNKEVEDARALLRYNSQKKYESASAALQKLVDFNIAGGAQASQRAEVSHASARAWILAALGSAILLGAVLAVAITRSITVPIRQALSVAEAVSQGDLSSQIHSRGSDEAAQLLQALDRMNGNLSSVVSEVRHSSEQVAVSSREMADGGTDLSQRTEHQAARLQRVVSSLDEIRAAVEANATAAQDASRFAQGAVSVAGKGSGVMHNVVDTMLDISRASAKIGEIISIIDGIAAQTNILALNAAVESARAGEAGRGFGVVAGEVRSLAQRSAQAAKDIKQLVDRCNARVAAGSGLVGDAGQAMEEVVAQVTRVSALIAHISASTADQNAGIADVHEAVQMLDQATQQNAALVEQSAAASESLSQQAQTLVNAVAVFKLSQRPAAEPADALANPVRHEAEDVPC